MKQLFVLMTLISYQLAYSQTLDPQTNTYINTTPWGTTTTSQTTTFYNSGGAGQTYVNGAASNTVQAKKETGKCSGTNFMSCVIAAAAIIQVGVMVAGYLDSKKTNNASQCQGDFCNGTGSTDTDVNSNTNPTTPTLSYTPDGPNDPMDNIVTSARESAKTLADKGFVVDVENGSVKTPNGTMSADQISASAGEMSDAEKRALGIESASASATASVKPGEFEGSSETGGGKKPSSGGGESAGAGFDMNAYMRNLMGNSDGNRGVAGLSVRAGDDNIGVRESNIFEQVSRAYGTDKVLNRGP